jgi:cold shock CspA family protein
LIYYWYLFLSFKNINATGFKALEQGQDVEFTAVQGEKGLEARVSFRDYQEIVQS